MPSYFNLVDETGDAPILLNRTVSTLSSFQILRYAMQTPQPSSMRGLDDGSSTALSPWMYQNVSESIELLVGNSPDLARDALRSIEKLFEAAQRRQNTAMGTRVFIQRQLDSDEGETWRSEILSGRITYTNLPAHIDRGDIEATLNITRRWFWEGPEEELSVESSEDAATTGGVTVYSNDDASSVATNWALLTVPANDTLPAPIRLSIANAQVTSVDYRELYVANTVFSDPANFDPFLLGSEALGGATFAWSTAVEEVAWRWTPAVLTDARLTDLGGRYYRILVAFADGATTGLYLRATIDTYIGGVAYSQYVGGRVYYSGGELVDLGVLPIPPGGYDLLGSDVSVKIAVYKPDGGSSSMTVDFVQLTPAGDGLFQRTNQVGYSVAPSADIVIDGINDIAYYNDAGRHRPIVRPRGLPILVWPGEINKLRILMREADGFVAGRKFTVRAYYRPRRLDI
jgi:hypothetical protein